MKIVLFKSFLSNKLNFEFCLISLEYNVCHLQKIPTIEAFKVFEGSNFQRTSTEVKVKVNEGEIKHSVEYFCWIFVEYYLCHLQRNANYREHLRFFV